ncbi:hypothetical protein NMP99_09065 [Glutamicibacter mishrai]|uniref:hypothetical protein n=1 Tax=Glutamicibacter mishrai TaxID=1775880 RepID=UPI0020CF95CD|nr:hypothetical protein [Glutamicibacter mishrai]UTT38221.1 hypothetical protein NMP99_09065 [Glutamicibacter mishrai]
MNSDPTAPSDSLLRRLARKRIFSSEKMYRHSSALAHHADDAVAQTRYQALRNEQWIYL